ncbi:MAG: YdeI/OmpD-associated family protein [Deltaproteobacteria bacterium]|nr:YdeI/OmpD-associated family protein [Deltaproteobacteria bacterium]
MSLAKKLLIKPGHKVLVLRAPQIVADAIAPPAGVQLTTSNTARGPFDVVLIFVSSGKGLGDHAPKALAALAPDGVLWFAYPKKTSGVSSDLSRDEGWQPLRSRGWGPVAQVALDATWSAVRFKPEESIERQVPAPTTKAPSTKTASSSGGVKRPSTDLVVPDELNDGLKKNKAANTTWKALSPSHKREYVSWITEAKKPETRSRRIAQALEMLAAGIRDRNAKYRGTEGA